MSESIPSSMASFARRRSRRESNVSFTYFQENQETPNWGGDEEAIEIDDDVNINVDEDAVNGDIYAEDYDAEREPSIRPSSFFGPTRSRSSVEDPLLWRRSSETEYRAGPPAGVTVSQKIYIATEDLTAVIAGFSTSVAGFAAYIIICILSCGTGYLLFRWVPRWKTRLIGKPEPLYKCQWVAIEVRYYIQIFFNDYRNTYLFTFNRMNGDNLMSRML